MPGFVPEGRELATKVAAWLVEKEQPDVAVVLLSAWAAMGPNDSAGQRLLADALRIDPSSKEAQLAFERMEGIEGEHSLLEKAIETYSYAELQRIEREMRKPTFRNAQMGFNNNIKFQDQVFHVQTEDSGLDAPHIITHLFADGGRVVKSHKRSYADEVKRADVTIFVRELMKAQHLEMVMALRDGRFQAVLEGKERGGLTLLTEPPNVDVRKLTKKKTGVVPKAAEVAASAEAQAPAGSAPAEAAGTAQSPAAESPVSSQAAEPFAPLVPQDEQAPSQRKVGGYTQRPAVPASADPLSATQAIPLRKPSSLFRQIAPVSIPRPDTSPSKRLYRLTVLRSLSGGPEFYELRKESASLGSQGDVALKGEKFVAGVEGTLQYRDGRLWFEESDAQNGVFLRIRTPAEMELGDEFVVGDQLLVVQANVEPDDGPDPAPTYFYSSPKWPSAFRVVQLFEGGAEGACLVARGNTLQIGSVMGDLVFSDDPLVDHQHCIIEETAGTVLLTDLDSRTGVFVRLRGEQELFHGDELLIGRTRLRVDLELPAQD